MKQASVSWLSGVSRFQCVQFKGSKVCHNRCGCVLLNVKLSVIFVYMLMSLLSTQRREKGKMRVHKLQNVQNVLDYLQKVKKIKLVNIRNDEIVDGNPKLILGLLWTLILHFQVCVQRLSGILHGQCSGMQKIFQWEAACMCEIFQILFNNLHLAHV